MIDRKIAVACLSLPLSTIATTTAHPGEFSHSGLLRSELAFSTTGDRSQANDKGTDLDNQGRWLNLAALRFELDGTYAFDRRTFITGRLRGWGDWTNQIDNHYDPGVELFDGSQYPGDWALLCVHSKNAIADINELYIDWTRGGVWLRAGKQQIAWGHAIGMRILDDMVSSLDVRRHGGNFGLASEEFLDERIGQIGLRGSWRVPSTGWELEGLITDFAPTQPYAAGSAYANFPGSLVVDLDEGMRGARDEPVYGLRARGLVLDGRGELTFAWTRRPQAIGPLSFAGIDGNGIVSEAEFPRIHTVGGAFSYSFSADPLGSLAFFDGLIARVESAYYKNKKFTNDLNPSHPQPPFESNEWSTGLVVEKNYKFRAEWPSTFFVFESWYRSDADLNERFQKLDGHDGWSWLLLSVNQNLMRNEILAALTTAHDTNGGWYLQPAVTWKPRYDLQLDVYANLFSGDDDDVYGPLEPNKEMAIRLGMYF
jgi:hypothetical protein